VASIFTFLNTIRERWPLASVNEIVDVIDAMARKTDGYIGDLFRTDYAVEGAVQFPIDMLRYTCSWPKEELDAHRIARLQLHGSHTTHRIWLTKQHRDFNANLARDRWASFHWTVVDHATVSI
jgi:hypothetical protein